MWPFSRLWSEWSSGELHSWVSQMAVGALVAPLAFCAGLTLAFWLLARSRTLISLIVTGLTLAVVPPAVTYLLGAEISANVVVTSVITGLAGIVSSAVAESVKRGPSAKAA